MKGLVDDKLRALLRVAVAASSDDQREEIVVWIDTAFNGGLVILRKRIDNHCENAFSRPPRATHGSSTSVRPTTSARSNCRRRKRYEFEINAAALMDVTYDPPRLPRNRVRHLRPASASGTVRLLRSLCTFRRAHT